MIPMAYTIWPIVWPKGEPPADADPMLIERAEYYAGTTLRMLTLNRVGGSPITVMPSTAQCRKPMFGTYAPVAYPLSGHDLKVCWCAVGCGCPDGKTVFLEAPVGRIESVVVDGITVDPAAYRVENGNRLVRTDGKLWPSCAGEDRFVVTYLNAYVVDAHGSYIGGLLAAEFLKALTADKKCALPKSITSLSRQGINMQIAVGMFPEGQTGIQEVDAYTMLWNPNGMKMRPRIYSPDMPAQRQVSWRAW